MPDRPNARRWVMVSVALAACLAAGLAAGLWIHARQDAAAPGWTGVQLGGSSIAFTPRISPDGRTLAFVAMVDDLTQVAVMNPASGHWTILTRDRSQGAVTNLCWSRDGANIYFDRLYGVPRGVFQIPALGGEERLILEDATHPEILADGSLLVVRIGAGRNLQLHRYWPESGRLQALGALFWNPWVSPFRVSPDSREVVFFGQPVLASKGGGQPPVPSAGPAHLYALDINSGRTRRLAPELRWDLRGSTVLPLAITPDGRSVLTAVGVGDSHRVVAIPRNGSGPAQTLLSFTSLVWYLDVGSDGSLYLDQVERPYDVLRFSVSGGSPERLASSTSNSSYGPLQFPDGRILLPSLFSGRNRLLLARPAKDPVPFAATEEETSPPMARLGEREVVFLAGTGADRSLAISSLADGRIVRRFSPTKGLPITSLAASPDGKTVYYSASGNLWAIPAGGGDARSLAAGDGVAADPNGQDLIVQRNEKEGVRLLRLALSARSERPIPFSSELQISADLIAAHSVSTDGRIVVAAISKDSWFYMAAVLQPKTGKVQQIPLRYAGDIFPPGWTRDGKILAPGLQMRASLWRFQKESKP